MSGPLRRIGLFTAACLLVSNMIGTGIFGTTGFMAADLGSPTWILALWAAGMLYALAGASCYGELGAAMPRAGGEYVYIRAAFGPLWGFLSGWTSFTVAFSAAIAANAALFADHLRVLVPALRPSGGNGWPDLLARARVVELVLVWGLTAVHAAGLGPGGLVQRLLTVLKVAAIAGLIGLGLTLGEGHWTHLSHADPTATPRAGLALVSFLYVTFAYSGWNASSYVASEIEDPARNLPRSMIAGTLVVGLAYLGLNVVYLYALPVEELAGQPSVRALVGQRSAQALFGPGAGAAFTGLLLVSIAGATSAMIWTGPRVYQAMAQDGVLPRFFARTSPKGGVPVRSIALQSLWVSALVLLGTFDTLVKYTGAATIAFAGLGVASLLVLRRRRPDLARPFRVWAYPLVPLLYLACSAAVLVAAVAEELATARRQGDPSGYLAGSALTVLAGVGAYALCARSGRRSPPPGR